MALAVFPELFLHAGTMRKRTIFEQGSLRSGYCNVIIIVTEKDT